MWVAMDIRLPALHKPETCARLPRNVLVHRGQKNSYHYQQVKGNYFTSTFTSYYYICLFPEGKALLHDCYISSLPL